MATIEHFILQQDNKNSKIVLSSKRIIELSSDDDETNEINTNCKRQRASSKSDLKPLQLFNEQPTICKTRQTLLSIVKTNHNDNSNVERKWNLQTINSPSDENSSKKLKRKTTQTKSTGVSDVKSLNSFVRTVSSCSIDEIETKNENAQTMLSPKVERDKNDDSKMMWKKIFNKSDKNVLINDELKEQWSKLDKDQFTKSKYRFNSSTNDVKRICPFYKKIPGTTFCIDAFNFGNIDGIQAYFLSHFHSDHYGGLNKKFSNMLYSNQITCNLCQSQLGISPENMTVLPMNTFTNVHGVDVALIDANHCPGSNMFLFRFTNEKFILHTGDFRAAPHILENPLLRPNQIDTIYLDTTYCDSQYRFPPQDQVIDSAVELVVNSLSENPKTLITIGSYLVGKERIFHAIAKTLDCKIYVDAKKFRILNQLEINDLSKRLTRDPSETNVHVIEMSSITQQALENYSEKYLFQYNKIIGMKPTGWTTPKATGDKKCYSIESQTSRITIYGLPYSEHSSFDELKNFIQYLKPKRIIPTVNVGRANVREKMNGYFKLWLSL